jgi:hypothetical protein
MGGEPTHDDEAVMNGAPGDYGRLRLGYLQLAAHGEDSTEQACAEEDETGRLRGRGWHWIDHEDLRLSVA